MFSIASSVTVVPRSIPSSLNSTQPKAGAHTPLPSTLALEKTLKPMGLNISEFYRMIKLTPEEKIALQQNFSTGFKVVEEKLGLVVQDRALGRVSTGFKQNLEGTFDFSKTYLPTIEALVPFIEAQLQEAK